ncbi:hypothetical protein SEUCBS139899_008220 [Sporothrix eucalyptigena]
MAEASPSVKPEENTPKAAKDRNCPYCGQAFTSSSLGRHLDLYIKERNPKKQDGIHNVEEIRRLRGGITRRNPKGSKRRSLATPVGTPSATHRRDDASDQSSNAPSPAVREMAGSSAGTSAADIASMFPIGGVRWEATGVMNEVMVTSPDGTPGADSGMGDGSRSMADMDTRGFNPYRRPMASRVVSRQAVRTQLDSNQRMQDALDDARAAELALREFATAWRAAKQQIELGSMPFDFDPMTMNFPALTLQCLRAQPTLFASTQLPTPASWSTSPPGASQFEALKGFFKEEFRKWRVKCASATTAQYEELKYPPSPQFQHVDRRHAIERAEQSANALEQEASKHLEIAFNAWDELSDERKNELWVLELARGIATKQTEIDRLRDAQSSLRQEAASLKSQIEQLNRLQQPREFKLVPPAHIPMDERVLFELQDAAVSQGSRGVGLNLNDRHSDLSTIVATAISRWKNVIVSSRASTTGMAAQRPLSTPTGPGAPPAYGPTTHGPPTMYVQPASTSSVTSPVAASHPPMHQTPAAPMPEPTPAPSNPAMHSPKQARRNPRALAQPPPAPLSATTASSATSIAPPQPTARPMPPPPTTKAPVPPTESKGTAGKSSKTDQSNEDDDEEEGDDGEEEGEEDDEEEDEENGDDAVSADQMKREPTVETGDCGASDEAEDAAEDDDYEEDASDKDADAEMEDGDEFAHMHTPISTATSASKPAALLKIPRTRNAAQQIPRTTGASGIGLINASRSMPNINVPIHGNTQGQHMALGGDAMYMD